MSAMVDPQRFCGQDQAHHAHRWVTPQSLYAACSGKACSCAAHDAEVAARALREAADVLDDTTAWAALDLPHWLRARADRVAGHTPQEQP